MTTEEINIKATFTDEISAKIQGALDTFVEFGASQDQVATAFERINKSSKVGMRGIAQTSNALRKLVDETEDADLAMRGLEKSFEVAEAAGIKLEDAAADVGRALKGQTDILQKFDERAKAAAKAIDGITDPALRAKAIMRELNAATLRQNGLLAKLSNQFKLATAIEPNLTRSLKAVALGFTGITAAVSAFTVKSVKAYVDGSAAMKKKTDSLSKSFKSLQVAFGNVAAEAIGLGEGFENTKKEVDDLSKLVVKNRVPIAQSLRDIALAAVYAGEAITMPIKGIMLFLAFIDDVITEIIKGISLIPELLLKAFAGFAKLQGKIKTKLGFDVTPAELENIEKATAAMKQLAATRKRIDPFAKSTELTNAFNAGGEVIDKFKDLLKTKVSPFDLEKQVKKKTAGPTKTPIDPTAAELLAFGPSAAELGGTFMQTMQGIKTEEEELAQVIDVVNANLETQSTRFASLGEVGKQVESSVEGIGKAVEGSGKILDDFTTKVASQMVGALDGFVFALAKGGDAMKDFGKGLLMAFGDLTSQIGQALVLLSLGVGKVGTGDFTGALGIGLGLIAFGAALKGFASRTSGGGVTAEGGDGSTARALERFGRRLFERDDPSAGREVVINIDGRQMRGFVLDSVNNAVRARQVPALRRAT